MIEEGFVLIAMSEVPDKTSWMPLTCVKDSRKFVCLEKCDKRFQRFLGGDFTMVDYIRDLRNLAVDRLLKKAETEKSAGYKDTDTGDDGHPLKRPRKEVFDDIDSWTTVSIDTSEGVKFINVLCSVNDRYNVWVELSNDNMNLLVMKPASSGARPAAVQQVDVPTVNEAHVTWMASRTCLRTRWYDSKKGRWATRSVKVEHGEDFQSRVDEQARQLEELYLANHTHPPQVRAAALGGA